MNSINSVQMSSLMAYNSNVTQNLDSNTDANINKNIPKIENSSENDINNQAVNVSISMQSMQIYVQVRSLEFVQTNTEAQDMLHNIFNNKEVFHFLDGREASNGLNLKDIGYEGKPITQLTASEAKELVSEKGFFGVEQTSDRVSNFAFGISNGDVELLKESRKGIVKGFEEAEKLWGGELPEISYLTQEKTLEKIDKRIAELLNKDKSVEDKNSQLGDSPAEALAKEDNKKES
ncbi:TM1812 family CRISPR-associated protein [Arcobacter sp.]|uniref:TM1812 family CRISPR-associated protein n=1 Tax=Arcobacter sp. TaxID=1872629 RepID=UPI003D13AD37